MFQWGEWPLQVVITFAPAEKIFVNRETITGSIGVIMESINYAKLAEKYGVDFNTIKTGPYKDIMSPSREMKVEEREMLQEMISDSYERFVEIIVDGRKMTEAEVKKVADGTNYEWTSGN